MPVAAPLEVSTEDLGWSGLVQMSLDGEPDFLPGELGVLIENLTDGLLERWLVFERFGWLELGRGDFDFNVLLELVLGFDFEVFVEAQVRHCYLETLFDQVG